MKKLSSTQVSSKKQKGSVAVEYMILTVFIGLTIAAGATYLGQALNDKFYQTGKMVYSMNAGNNGGGGVLIGK